MKGENEMSIEDATHDTQRIDYYKGYLKAVEKAVTEEGIDIQGYFAWSLAECVAWRVYSMVCSLTLSVRVLQQLGVDGGVHPALWMHLCRSQEPGIQALPERVGVLH